MANIAAKRGDRLGRAEAATQEADAVELAKPLAINHVALAAGHVPHVVSVGHDDFEASRLENLEQRDPVHSCGFHGHAAHATSRKPVRKPVKIRREGLE